MTTLIKIQYAESTMLMEEPRDVVSRISSGSSTINKELLVNKNCNIGLIMDYIKGSIDLKSAEFDLWEESTGEMKNISSLKPWISGMEVFQGDDTYLCIIVERNSNGRLTNYVPLIGGKVSRALSDFIAKTKKFNKKKSLPMATIAHQRDNAGRKRLSGKEK